MAKQPFKLDAQAQAKADAIAAFQRNQNPNNYRNANPTVKDGTKLDIKTPTPAPVDNRSWYQKLIDALSGH